MKEIYLSGSYYDMGLQYGQASKKDIKLFIKAIYFMVSISKKPGSTAFSPNMRYFLQTLIGLRKEKKKFWGMLSMFDNNIKRYYPEALEMIKGIAEGAGCQYEDVLFLNIATDVLLNCSCWGASGISTKNGEVLLGMNADEEKMVQKYEYIIHMNPDDGYAVKGTAMAGSVCLNHGMNEHGLTIVSHLFFLKSKGDHNKDIPLFVLLKSLFRHKTVDETFDYYKSLPNIDIGAVVYVGDEEKFMKVECSSQDRVYEMVESGSRGSTNIPDVPCIRADDLFEDYEDHQNMNAIYRYKRMKNLLDKIDGHMDMKAMHEIASDHGGEDETKDKSICQHGKIKTVVTFIGNPKEKYFQVYEGNPCEGKMKEIYF